MTERRRAHPASVTAALLREATIQAQQSEQHHCDNLPHDVIGTLVNTLVTTALAGFGCRSFAVQSNAKYGEDRVEKLALADQPWRIMSLGLSSTLYVYAAKQSACAIRMMRVAGI